METRRPGDRELLQACRQGDEDAWEALVQKYRHLVYSVPYRLGLGAEQAAEVFQAVFLALFRHLDHLRQEETLIPWLLTTARRECWKLGQAASREAKSLQVLEESLPVADPSAPGDLEAIERQAAVRAALDGIEDRCRRLLEILFYRDPPPPYSEISREMGMPVASIGPTRLRCLEKLQRRLRRTGLF